MATITLYKDKLNGVGGLIDNIIKSSNSLDTQLGTLKSTLQGVSNSTYNLQDTVNSISSSSKTEKEIKIADTLETDPNTILGVKNNVASVDEALNELPLEMKSKLSVLFGAMINQIKEQDVIN